MPGRPLLHAPTLQLSTDLPTGNKVVDDSNCTSRSNATPNQENLGRANIFTRQCFSNKDTAVINLSSKVLTESQLSLLSKGLKFVPTRRNIDKGKLIADLGSWERRMRLKEYFFEEGEEDLQEYDKRKKKSSWTPEAGRDKWLDAYIQNVKDDIISGLKRNFRMNVSNAEEKAMRELLDDNTVVI